MWLVDQDGGISHISDKRYNNIVLISFSHLIPSTSISYSKQVTDRVVKSLQSKEISYGRTGICYPVMDIKSGSVIAVLDLTRKDIDFCERDFRVRQLFCWGFQDCFNYAFSDCRGIHDLVDSVSSPLAGVSTSL